MALKEAMFAEMCTTVSFLAVCGITFLQYRFPQWTSRWYRFAHLMPRFIFLDDLPAAASLLAPKAHWKVWERDRLWDRLHIDISFAIGL